MVRHFKNKKGQNIRFSKWVNDKFFFTEMSVSKWCNTRACMYVDK